MKTSIITLTLIIIGGLFSPIQAQRKTDKTPVHAGNNVYYRFGIDILEKSIDGAKTWKLIDIPQVTAFDNGNTLPFFLSYSMQWMDENNGYLFGDDGTYAYAATIFRTFNGGKTWHVFHAENISQSGMYLKKITMLDDKHHFAFFGITDNWTEKKNPRHSITYAYSTNGGKSWDLGFIELDDKIRQIKGLNVDLLKDGTGTITNDSGNWVTNDFGKSWKAKTEK
jgi:photosystem II stability/assembly factor-like uncharacterized protein